MLHEEIQAFRGEVSRERDDPEAAAFVYGLLDCAEILDEWYDHEMYPARYPNTVDRTRVRIALEKLKKAVSHVNA